MKVILDETTSRYYIFEVGIDGLLRESIAAMVVL